jgi:hypothetical protein
MVVAGRLLLQACLSDASAAPVVPAAAVAAREPLALAAAAACLLLLPVAVCLQWLLQQQKPETAALLPQLLLLPLLPAAFSACLSSPAHHCHLESYADADQPRWQQKRPYRCHAHHLLLLVL